MWADDVLVVNQTPKELQSAIDKTYSFFQSLDLTVNVKKTKVIIFNPRGIYFKSSPELNFMCGSP